MGDATCSEPGCPDPLLARGLCSKHYQRHKRTGSTVDYKPQACDQCGDEFTPRRRDQIYCSDPCKVRARPKRPKTTKYSVECKFCGDEFMSPRGGLTCAKTACKRAYQAEATERSRAKQPPRQRPCAECGNQFIVTANCKAYCSPACKRASLLRRRRDREYQPEPKDCLQCGQPVPYKSGRKRFCSDECRRIAVAKDARWRVKGLTRDHGMVEACGLCGASKRLYIDHDHACCPGERSCGKCVRGFLCSAHNIGLGLFGDDPALLRAAADYVERHRAALII